MHSSVGSVPIQPGAHTGTPAAAASGEAATWPDEQRRAFAALYRAHVTEIYRYCYRLLGNRQEAEDATSQVFTKALAAFATVDSETEAGSLRSWLFAIAHNVAIDALRQRRTVSLPDEANRLADRAPPVEEQAVADDDLRRLHQLLAELSPDQRRVVELRLSGLTGDEIAAVLGRRRGAIDGLQFRAVAKLRQLFAAEIGSPGRKDHADAES